MASPSQASSSAGDGKALSSVAGGIVEVLERWLQSPMGASCCSPSDGAVPICDAVFMCAELRQLTGGSLAAVADAVSACPPEGPIACTSDGQFVRLRGLSERVRTAAENHIFKETSGGISLLDLLSSKTVSAVLAEIPETKEQLQVLRGALSASGSLEVTGSRASVRPDATQTAGPRPRSLPACSSTSPRSSEKEEKDGGRSSDAASDGPADRAAQAGALRTPSSASSPERVVGGEPAHFLDSSPEAVQFADGVAPGPLWCQPEPEGLDAEEEFGPGFGAHGAGQWVWCPNLPLQMLPVSSSCVGRAGPDDSDSAVESAANDAALAPGAGGFSSAQVMLPLGYSMLPPEETLHCEVPSEGVAWGSPGPSGAPAAARAAGDEAGADPDAQQSGPPAGTAGGEGQDAMPLMAPGQGEGQWVWFPADAFGGFLAGEGADQSSMVKSRKKRGRRSDGRPFETRQSGIVNKLYRLLQFKDPPADLADHVEPDGSVRAAAILRADKQLSEWCFNNPNQLVLTVCRTADWQRFLVADRERMTVRLLTRAERLCIVCENYMLDRQSVCPGGSAPLPELLQFPLVQSLLADSGSGTAASSSDSDYAAWFEGCAAGLREALEESVLLELREGEVSLLHPSRPLSGLVRTLLDTDQRTQAMLRRDREVSLPFLADHLDVRKMLQRLRVEDQNAILAVLRDAVQQLEGVQLDESGMSMRLQGPAPKAAGGKRLHKFQRERLGSKCGLWEPEEKYVKKLRELFSFYFSAFNLQHNKLLMSCVEAFRNQEAHRSCGYLRGGGQRPYFGLSDIKGLPRIAAILDRYDPEAVGWLLEAAIQTEEPLPVKLSWRGARSGAKQRWQEPAIELTYTPQFRFMEVVRRGPEVEPLLAPEPLPYQPPQALPGHAICVISYSISSDLSHSQSPKAQGIHEKILDGEMDAGVLTWDERQRKLVRQLKMYYADVICLQGIQSIGFKERNSETETDREWFSCDDEPATNHLVHLYREMSKDNYGIVFTPVLEMPSSSALCLGNAILWKRNRWNLLKSTDVAKTGVIVELRSKLSAPPLAICSYKSPDVWAMDWGAELPEEELISAALRAQESLAAAAADGDLRPLLCGDFALEPGALLPQLAGARAGQGVTWQSACESVCGESPWTAAIPHSEGKATDLVLHDRGLRALAALGGLQERMSLSKFLEFGHPAEHLMQVAVFVDAERDIGVSTETRARKRPSHQSKDCASGVSGESPYEFSAAEFPSLYGGFFQ